jgi:hypothetical protein
MPHKNVGLPKYKRTAVPWDLYQYQAQYNEKLTSRYCQLWYEGQWLHRGATWPHWEDDWGSHPGGGWDFFFSPTPCPDRLRGSPSLKSNGYRGFFLLGLSGRVVKESAKVKQWAELYLHSPNTSSWRGDQLSTGTTVPLPLPLRGSKRWASYKLALKAMRIEFGSSVSIVTRLPAGRPKFDSWQGHGYFHLHNRLHTRYGAQLASYTMGTEDSYPEGKTAGAWSWPLTSTSAEVQYAWRYTSTPQYVFMAWCLVKHRDNFTFTFTLCSKYYPNPLDRFGPNSANPLQRLDDNGWRQNSLDWLTKQRYNCT